MSCDTPSYSMSWIQFQQHKRVVVAGDGPARAPAQALRQDPPLLRQHHGRACKPVCLPAPHPHDPFLALSEQWADSSVDSPQIMYVYTHTHARMHLWKQDPNLERYAAEEFAGQVFATDAVLAHLMTCARSVSVRACVFSASSVPAAAGSTGVWDCVCVLGVGAGVYMYVPRGASACASLVSLMALDTATRPRFVNDDGGKGRGVASICECACASRACVRACVRSHSTPMISSLPESR